MKNKVVSWFKAKLHLVASQKGSKHSIALGIAIGFFWGFSPLFGFKTLFSFLTAWLVRANKIAALVAVTLHDVFLPVYPLFLALSYFVGNKLLGVAHPAHVKLLKITRVPLAEAPEDWWDDPTVTFHYLRDAAHTFFGHLVHNLPAIYPLLLGSVLLALPICVATYFLTIRLLCWYERRQAAKIEAAGHPGTFDVCGKPFPPEEK